MHSKFFNVTTLIKITTFITLIIKIFIIEEIKEYLKNQNQRHELLLYYVIFQISLEKKYFRNNFDSLCFIKKRLSSVVFQDQVLIN